MVGENAAQRKTPHATESHERCSKLLSMHMLMTILLVESWLLICTYLAWSFKCLLYTFISFLDLSKAQRSFAQVLNDLRFEYIGEVETDDEMLIGEYLTTAFLQERTKASLLNSYVDLWRSGYCFWLVVPWEKFVSTKWKHSPDLESDVSWVWNFCSHSQTSFHGEHQLWCWKMLAIFLGLLWMERVALCQSFTRVFFLKF